MIPLRLTRLAFGIGLALTVVVSAEAGHGRTHRPIPSHAPKPILVAPAFPQYYIKAHDGSAIPVVPVFVVPVAPPPAAPVPIARPSCYRFFCD
jgi:hypothetical protein